MAGVFVDFDGTLSPIVPRAADARPLPGVGEVLRRPHPPRRSVGRGVGPARLLPRRAPPGRDRAARALRPRGAHRGRDPRTRRRGTLAPGRRRGRRLGGGGDRAVRHRRGAQGPLADAPLPPGARCRGRGGRCGPAKRRLGRGCSVRAAKLSLELHPPVAVDKGTVVEDRSEGLTAVAYVGDDVGDLPAFDALDRLAARGRHVVKVAVRTPEPVRRARRRTPTITSTGPTAPWLCLRSLSS